MTEKPAPTTQPIHPLLAGRHSPRAFDGERTVDVRTLHGLLEAAIWAPSCNNAQPWRFVLGARGADAALQQRWDHIYAGLAKGNQVWCQRAAAFVVTLASRTFAWNGKPNAWAWHDTGMAGLALALEAHARGLCTHPMAGYDAETLRASLQLPEELDVVTVWAIGWPGDIELLPVDVRDRELAPRTRKPLAEVLLG